MNKPVLPAKLEVLALDRLVPYARNARTHSETQVAEIAASIREFGFTNPVLISDEGDIIAGHGRVMAARQLGLGEVPCIRLSHLSDAQRRAYVLADNKLAEKAGWDNELLRLELGELAELGFDLGLTGFDKSELDALMLGEDDVDAEGLTGDDDAPGLKDDPVSRSGDVWILGDHRVMCGDSTSIEAVEALCAGDLVDCVWTDPPYNVAYETKAGKIDNDNLEDGQFRQFLLDAYSSAWAVMKPGAAIYVAHADTEGLNFRAAFREVGLKLSGCLIWRKNALVLGRSDYQWRHEPILYGWKPGAAHRWFGGRAQTTVHEFSDAPFIVSEDGSVQIEIGETVLRISGADLKVEELVGSVVTAEKPRRSVDHPTMKPVELILPMVKNSSRRGDLVLDLFGGSGSTLIACQKSGRKARLMEFDPGYCDVIVRRWQEWTGRVAHLEAGGDSFEVLSGKRRTKPKKCK
ncbi:site-specific DNA-methyltransferase [Paracoccus homiensis]|uniref:site-specific DNA-methyltransferase (adenine-specific) n=1 Tax=Paracoccus homiensis TaxID=364199 RepID=A0A1H9YAJ4_9RHOB|nr:site-specific DNA-methyltransferase [Paracoccus homiensis]SES65960.1 DNA modification methylase [Paracoccus homiensis]